MKERKTVFFIWIFFFKNALLLKILVNLNCMEICLFMFDKPSPMEGRMLLWSEFGVIQGIKFIKKNPLSKLKKIITFWISKLTSLCCGFFKEFKILSFIDSIYCKILSHLQSVKVFMVKKFLISRLMPFSLDDLKCTFYWQIRYKTSECKMYPLKNCFHYSAFQVGSISGKDM